MRCASPDLLWSRHTCAVATRTAVVDFRDPLTRYSSLAGYLGNIAMLRKVCACT